MILLWWRAPCAHNLWRPGCRMILSWSLAASLMVDFWAPSVAVLSSQMTFQLYACKLSEAMGFHFDQIGCLASRFPWCDFCLWRDWSFMSCLFFWNRWISFGDCCFQICVIRIFRLSERKSVKSPYIAIWFIRVCCCVFSLCYKRSCAWFTKIAFFNNSSNVSQIALPQSASRVRLFVQTAFMVHAYEEAREWHHDRLHVFERISEQHVYDLGCWSWTAARLHQREGGCGHSNRRRSWNHFEFSFVWEKNKAK